jgi:hypothetical protein
LRVQALLTTIAWLATPGHTRILFLGRFRVKEDADFLRLATERGFRVEVSDTKGRQGTADYQLIELGWPSPADTAAAAAAVSAAAHQQSSGVSGSVKRSGPAGSSGTFVLQKDAFAQLQQALSSRPSSAPYPHTSAAGQGCLDLD